MQAQVLLPSHRIREDIFSLFQFCEYQMLPHPNSDFYTVYRHPSLLHYLL